MILLENAHLRAGVKPQGAELASLTDKTTGLDYVWQAGAVWPKRAPLLFPIVGMLKGGVYTHQGQSYSLPRHGFAAAGLFSVIQDGPAKALFRLEASEETLKQYPFPFALEVEYLLEGRSLQSRCTVRNTGKGDLLYSFGLHPAFTLCFEPGDGIGSLSLILDRDEDWLSTAGLNADSTHYPREKNFGRRTLALNGQIFNEDALIFEGLESRALTLAGSQGRSLRMKWSDNLPILGIWSKPEAPFVCIEPWAGICDPQDTDGELAHKKGILRLQAGAHETFSYGIEILPQK